VGNSKRNGRFSQFLAAVLFGAAVICPCLVVAAEQKIALVIGNSAYPSSRLRNPVNDAKAMAEKLKSLGFDVMLHTDSNLREMTRSFSQFGQKLTPGSVSLFYYAGHGMQVRGKNYLIPVDAEIENEASVTTEAVDVDQLLNQLGPARLSMVILDACRNNPFERRFRAAVSGGLAQIDAPTGTMLAYATAPGKVASDGTGSNGLYTEALLNALNAPGLKVEDVFKQVRISVIKASDGQQTPWESSSLTGEFYFTADNKPAAADENLRRSEKERAELAKALDDERKKRDKDAELVRAEMEKLRAELQTIRTEAAKPVAPTALAEVTSVSAAKPESSSPPVKPAQVAIANPTPSATLLPSLPTSNSNAASVTPPTSSALPPQQIATIAPQSNGASSTSGEWMQRIALLEKNRGTLTFTKAIALLFDISSTDKLTQVTMLEKRVQEAGWANALAIGIGSQGKAVWAGAAKFRRPNFAIESALESCTKESATPCKVVFLNGDFQEKDFMEWAKRMKDYDLAQWRETFLKSVATSPKEIVSPGGQLVNIDASNMARIFTPPAP